MRAAYCTGTGTFEVRDREVPEPGPDDVIVRVHGCGVCGSDLHYFHGGFPPPAACPGHEIAGVITAAPAGSGLRSGQEVTIEPLVVCGVCSHCRTGNYQICPRFCVIGNAVDGGFAEYVRVPSYAVYPLPPGVDLELGGLTEPLAVAVHALRLARLEPGDRVLVLGGGTIGLMAVAAARAAGAGEVWITARHAQQEEAAQRLGATRVFRGAGAADELRAAARGDAVDVVIETVGGTAGTLGDAVRLARRGGTVMVLGIFTEEPRLDATTLVMKEIRLIGSMTYGRSGARTDFERALALLAANPDPFRALITHRIPLEEIARAFAVAGDKGSGAIKVQVRC
jgi:2-desacetyl-2-hydroxyethyl bacteriochlorophyllide A dehydrogenase